MFCLLKLALSPAKTGCFTVQNNRFCNHRLKQLTINKIEPMFKKCFLRSLLAALPLCATLPATAQDTPSRSTLTAIVQGVEGGECRWFVEAVPMSPFGETCRKDTITMRDGRFSLTIEGDTLFKAYLTPEPAITKKDGIERSNYSKTIEIYMQPGCAVNVKAALTADYTAYSVSGSPLNSTYAERLTEHRKANAARLEELFNALMSPDADSITRTRLNEEYMLISGNQRNDDLEYSLSHPDEAVAAAYIMECADDSVLVSCADRLSPDVRGGVFKSLIDERIKIHNIEKGVRDNRNNVRIGTQAPAFSYNDISGNTVSLAQFAGRKFVILDFWGSWCAWCIRGVPKMREYQNKYSDRLQIIGVDCNDKPEKMQAAIKKHQMEWIHLVNNDNDLDQNLMLRYAVQAFPTKVVISPDGRIADYCEGEEESFYTKLDELMKQYK